MGNQTRLSTYYTMSMDPVLLNQINPENIEALAAQEEPYFFDLSSDERSVIEEPYFDEDETDSRTQLVGRTLGAEIARPRATRKNCIIDEESCSDDCWPRGGKLGHSSKPVTRSLPKISAHTPSAIFMKSPLLFAALIISVLIHAVITYRGQLDTPDASYWERFQILSHITLPVTFVLVCATGLLGLVTKEHFSVLSGSVDWHDEADEEWYIAGAVALTMWVVVGAVVTVVGALGPDIMAPSVAFMETVEFAASWGAIGLGVLGAEWCWMEFVKMMIEGTERVLEEYD